MGESKVGRGKKTLEEKIEYYNENREDVVRNFLSKFQSPKEPAVAGTIVVAPILVTLLVVDWLFTKLAAIPGNRYFNIASEFGLTGTQAFYVNQTVKLAILLVLGAFMVTGIGRFVKTRSGFMMERSMDSFIGKIPLLGSVYNITKVTVDTVLTGPEGFKKPAKMEFGDYRVTAFKTGNRTADGREIVFIPTSPNITTGFVVEVDPENLIETGESAEDALTRVLSAGFGKAEGRSKPKGVAQASRGTRVSETGDPGYAGELEEILETGIRLYRVEEKLDVPETGVGEKVEIEGSERTVYRVTADGREALYVPSDSGGVLAVPESMDLGASVQLEF